MLCEWQSTSSTSISTLYLLFYCSSHFGSFLFFPFENKNVFFIETLYVASAIFDITWFFYGIENFKSVVLKNAIVKICECILVFLFVKQNTDLSRYTIIAAGGFLIGNILLIPNAIRISPPVKVSWQDIQTHFKPLFVLSISVCGFSL